MSLLLVASAWDGFCFGGLLLMLLSLGGAL
jgi:hypothetical protein